MHVTYRNTVKDFESLQSYVLRHTEFGRRSARNVFLSMTALFALFCLVIGVFVHWAMALASFAGGAAFFWLTKEMAIVSRVKGEYAKEIYRPLFEPVTVRVEEDGLGTERAGRDDLVRWAEVDHVADTGAHLVILMGARGHIVIPHGAFDDPESRADFHDAVWEQSGGRQKTGKNR